MKFQLLLPIITALPTQAENSTVLNRSYKRAQSGIMTYYNFFGGTGSCGSTHSDSERVVAVQSPRCGSAIQIIANNGKSVMATVVDTCPSCGPEHIDATPGVWYALGIDTSLGVVPIQWQYA